jgi:hypothetical protein
LCTSLVVWEAYCAKILSEETWKLGNVAGKHTCSREYRVMMMNCKWLGSKPHTRVRENRDFKISFIMERT